MKYLIAKKKGTFTYHGHAYELEPISYPEVNLKNILAVNYPMDVTICKENPETMQTVYFEAKRLPGFPQPLTVPPPDLKEGSRLMLVHGGGIGDIIMLTPALRHLKKVAGKKISISMSTFADCIPLIDETGCIDAFFPHPIRLYDFMMNCDFYMDFPDPKGIFNDMDMIDFYFDSLFFDPVEIPAQEKIPGISYSLRNSPAVIRELETLTSAGMTKVLFSGTASDRIRHLPPRILGVLAGHYPDLAFVVPSNHTGKSDEYPNVFHLDTASGLADFITSIGRCQATVCSDSSAYHIAASLDIPALVFFGPISSKIRSRYYPKVVVLDSSYSGHTCSAPCGISAIRESTPVRSIGKNRLTRLEHGMEILTCDGRSFFFDPEKGCPESNATDSIFSPCISCFGDAEILSAFEKTLSFLDRK